MDPDDSAEPPSIQDRTDTGGPWSAAGPLIALALIGAMLVNACLATRPAVRADRSAPAASIATAPIPDATPR
jgi:hypothetical protein